MYFKKVMITFLALILMGSSSFVYANETSRPAIHSEATEEALGELYHKAGLDSPEIILSTLADLGISRKELQEYVGQGKKIYDILQDKEIKTDQFKKALTKQYSCQIKKATKDKVITKKEAKILTNLLKEKMKSWDI